MKLIISGQQMDGRFFMKTEEITKEERHAIQDLEGEDIRVVKAQAELPSSDIDVLTEIRDIGRRMIAIAEERLK